MTFGNSRGDDLDPNLPTRDRPLAKVLGGVMKELGNFGGTPGGQMSDGLGVQEFGQLQNSFRHAAAGGLERAAQNLQQPVRQDHSPELVAKVIDIIVRISPVFNQRAAERHLVSSALHQSQQEVSTPDVAIAIQFAARNRPGHGDEYEGRN